MEETINPQQAVGISSAPVYDKSAEKTEKDFDSMPVKKKKLDWYCSYFGRGVYFSPYWREPWRIKGERITVFRFYKAATCEKYQPFDLIIDWPKDKKQAQERESFFDPKNYEKVCLTAGVEKHPLPVYWYILSGEIDDEALPRLKEVLSERFKSNVSKISRGENSQAKKKRSSGAQ